MICLLVVAMLIIRKASDWFEIASDYLGRKLSDWVKWATINAIAGSLPELFTTLFFLFYLKDINWFSWWIWTTAGSAIFNGMIIPALVILVVIVWNRKKLVQVSKKVILRDWLSLILAEIVLILLLSGTSLERRHGFVLISMYWIYVWYTLSNMSKKTIDTYEQEPCEDMSISKALFTLNLNRLVIGNNKINKKNSIVLLSISVAIIALSCMILVYTCEQIGNLMWIPIIFVSVVLASAASSIPDTIISMRDAKKWNYNDAVANALWSNIFDICFALWFPLLIYTLVYWPIIMNPETSQYSLEIRLFLLSLTICSFLWYLFKKKMGIWTVVFLISLYAIFLFYVFLR